MKLDNKELLERLSTSQLRLPSLTAICPIMSVRNGMRFMLRSPRGHC